MKSFPLALLSLLIASSLTAAPLGKGDKIPDTTLTSQSGEPVKLRELVSKKPSVLIFYRGGWCPYCTKHLAALAEIEADLLKAGYQLLAISPDQPSKLAETPGKSELNYELYSDSTLETAKGFGITFQVPDELVSKYKNEYKIDLEAASGQTHHMLPHPAVYVVQTDGTIRFAHVNEDYKVRIEPEKILEAVKAE